MAAPVISAQVTGKSPMALTTPGEYSRYATVVPAWKTGFHSACCDTTLA
jgi:hypothetical protein